MNKKKKKKALLLLNTPGAHSHAGSPRPEQTVAGETEANARRVLAASPSLKPAYGTHSGVLPSREGTREPETSLLKSVIAEIRRKL